LACIDTKLGQIIGDKEVNNISVEKDLKIGEIEFKDKGLQKLSEQVKK
jgi:hypothetical protein